MGSLCILTFGPKLLKSSTGFSGMNFSIVRPEAGHLFRNHCNALNNTSAVKCIGKELLRNLRQNCSKGPFLLVLRLENMKSSFCVLNDVQICFLDQNSLFQHNKS